MLQDLEKVHTHIISDSFIVTSFGNPDKNQAYSVVRADKDKSGYHGQQYKVVPKPSQQVVSIVLNGTEHNVEKKIQTNIEILLWGDFCEIK